MYPFEFGPKYVGFRGSLLLCVFRFVLIVRSFVSLFELLYFDNSKLRSTRDLKCCSGALNLFGKRSLSIISAHCRLALGLFGRHAR